MKQLKACWVDKEPCSLTELRTIERFISYEARLLNQGHYLEWCELFTDDGFYWVPSTPDQKDPEDTISIIYENKTILAVRTKRLQEGRAHSMVPMPQTVRIISNIEVMMVDSNQDEFHVTSNFIFLEHRDESNRYFGGDMEHILRRNNDQFQIMMKRVNLINSDSTHEFMAIPF
ncbi:MAG: aromatic-ring-hydroxylating dioxygenase subunit beta [Gammaproteobacteria bacterium]|jgi:3-phenylpropionate/cinnamic acid dioxygenase small subunit|nr:aromatic-ring-hydroxylating dioxygenase subunit beta [Gammaproteobacteria bacterium]